MKVAVLALDEKAVRFEWKARAVVVVVLGIFLSADVRLKGRRSTKAMFG